jgi:hypothetical protein
MITSIFKLGSFDWSVGPVQKSKRKTIETEAKLDTSNRFIYDCSHSWLGPGTFVNTSIFKLGSFDWSVVLQ